VQEHRSSRRYRARVDAGYLMPNGGRFVLRPSSFVRCRPDGPDTLAVDGRDPGPPEPATGPDKARFVRTMFDAIAARYDLMNRLMTGGRDEAWRRLAAGATQPETVRVAVDVGAGTGDLSFALARLAPQARVLAVDFAAQMLRRAEAKGRRLGLAGRVQPVLGDALALPVASGTADAVVTGFTLRNVADLERACAEFYRVLRPGGRLVVLELTPVQTPVFSRLFRLYFHRLVPLMGGLVSGRGYAYRYLPESVLRFPDAEQLRRLLLACGFAPVTYRKLALGTVALHIAMKGGVEQDQRQTAGHSEVPKTQAPQAGLSIASMRRVPEADWPAAREAETHEGRARLLVREVEHPAAWNAALQSLPHAHVLQTWERGEVGRLTGWVPRRLLFEQGGRVVAAASVLRRPLPLPGYGIAYCPKGPILEYGDAETFSAVLALLAEEARRQRCVFLRIDPDVEAEAQPAIACLRAAGFRPAPEQVQYRSTVLVDLRAGEDELLARMSSTWRRYIKKAAREGVTIRAGGVADLPRFYALYQETAARDRFIIRPYHYYERYFSLLARAGLAELFLAEVDGRPEAALVPFRLATRAWYIWGASSTAGQKAHAAYLLQWHTMRWAREQGCTTYDLWGAPDDPSDATDPLAGVYYFKRGFGGHHVRWAGAYDYVVHPRLYIVWNVALPRALGLYRTLKGEPEPPRPVAG